MGAAYAAPAATTATDASAFGGLLRFNLIVGLIHLVQAGVMLALSNDFTLPVTRGFLTGSPGTAPPRGRSSRSGSARPPPSSSSWLRSTTC